MHAAARTTVAVLTLTFLTVVACGDDGSGPTGPSLGDLDPIAVADAADALVVPLQPTLEPSVSLRSAFTYLTQQGLTFDREPSALVERARAVTGLDALGVARSVDFPPEMLGQTFVYNPDTGDWETDPEGSGAPANGARITWYSTGVGGQIGVPLVERGYIDLTDEDEGILSQLGVRIVDTTGATDLVLADFTEGYWTEGDVQWSEHFEAAGSYANTQRTTTFDLESDATGNDDTGDQDFSFDIGLSGESSYRMSLVGSDDGSTGDAEESYTITQILDGVSTRLELDLTVSSGGTQTGTGAIFHRSAALVDITVNGTSFQYSPAGGGDDFSGSQVGNIDILVQTMLQDGFIVLLNLPLLFL